MKVGDLVITTLTKRIGIIIADPVTFVRGREIVKEYISVAWADGTISNGFESEFLEVLNEVGRFDKV